MLDLSQNKLQGPIPPTIGNLTLLFRLDLRSNLLNGELPDTIYNYSNLQLFNIDGNQISGQLSHKWAVCKNLMYLLLGGNKISGEIPAQLGSLTKLRALNLASNELNGEIPSSICNLSYLELLDLSNNSLSNVIPQCLGNFSSELIVLDLRMNHFHGPIPANYTKCNNLRNLGLNGNQLEGFVPRTLANCRKLEVVDLGNNKLSDAFPHWMENLPELHVLVLRSNRFRGTISTTSKSDQPFPKLRIIDFSHNEFDGSLPTKYFEKFEAMMNEDDGQTGLKYLGDLYYGASVTLVVKGNQIELVRILQVFTTIDLSNNKFQGEIPNSIGKLISLRLLNLSHNSFTGRIPSLLSKLVVLESLDLSSNQLVGEIPWQLSSLTFLSGLNLSQNHLVGLIPQGRQFDTFENNSYYGNQALCGAPLTKKCTNDETPPTLLHEEGDSIFASGFTWKVVVIGYGCGLLFGLIMGCLAFLTEKPTWFVNIVEGDQHRKRKRSRKNN
ncbi:receptor-like protein 9DC3 [Cornus florida]|uniref:receptor-like protein 9DC3 n=1 Tax=Cornus florida TaxID=4283 RepID=UPI0028A111E8|nr:receptor-like protein 9DC3 [Cornus florida]